MPSPTMKKDDYSLNDRAALVDDSTGGPVYVTWKLRMGHLLAGHGADVLGGTDDGGCEVSGGTAGILQIVGVGQEAQGLQTSARASRRS